jgi:hypothetical protein
MVGQGMVQQGSKSRQGHGKGKASWWHIPFLQTTILFLLFFHPTTGHYIITITSNTLQSIYST